MSHAIMAIDYGTKRLGVAVTDSGRQFVFPRETVVRTTPDQDHAVLRDVCARDDVDLIVLGLPLNADGTEGPMAQAARKFAGELETALERRVVFADERYTSLEADDHLRLRFPKDTRRRRALRDRAAATLILKTFLEYGPYEA